MVSKRNFSNGGIAPYKRPNNFHSPMFGASQMENPGFMDFNNPTPQMTTQNTPAGSNKKKNKNKQKKPGVQQPQQQQIQSMPTANWKKNKINKNNPAVAGGFGFNAKFNGPRNFPPIMPPSRIMPHRGNMPMRMPPPPLPHGFNPMMPMMRGPGPLPPPMAAPLFTRRSGRNHAPPPVPRIPHPAMMRGMMPPPPFMPPNAGKIKKPPHPKLVKKLIKGQTTIQTLKNFVNKYPLDKPWITDAIRAEHQIKVDIENRLKGHKDDELFAQFKIQRDKFVAMYEAARTEHLESNKTPEVKDTKQANNKTASKDELNKAATPKKVAK